MKLNIILKSFIENKSITEGLIKEIIPLDTMLVGHAWSFDQWRLLDPSNYQIYLYRRENLIQCFALIMVTDVIHLLKIVTHEKSRRQQLASKILKKIVSDFESFDIIDTQTGDSLVGKNCRHPFIERSSPVVAAEYVTMDSGTGSVHIAPGHGLDDYLTKKSNRVLAPEAIAVKKLILKNIKNESKSS